MGGRLAKGDERAAPVAGGRRLLARRLAWLHRAYAWTLAFMAGSGLLLYLPALRAPLAPVRVPLRTLHIAGGLAACALLVIYLAHAVAHWRSLGVWLGKRLNTAFAVALALGWSLSGIVLWWDRALLPWTSVALWWHDVLTWIGLPYLVGHALLRWRRLDLALPWARLGGTERSNAPSVLAEYHRMQAMKRRRLFLSAALQLGALAAAWSGLGMLQRARGLLPPGEAAPATASYDPLPQPGPLSDPPVGGGARGRFRYYNVARHPFRFDPEKWRLTVSGLVERPFELTWPEVVALPRDVWVRDFHCVSGWSVYNVTWEGIPLAHLLDRAGVLPGATHVKFSAYDGVYTDALTLEQARLDDVFVALLKDGRPLTHEEGGPVRLVVGRMFAYKSVKWLQAIEVIDKPHLGFWERLGYDENAWIPGVPQSGPLPKIPRT